VYLTGRFDVSTRLLAKLAIARARLREHGSDKTLPVRIAGSSFALSPKGSENQFFASNDDLRVSIAPRTNSSRPNVQLVLSSALLWTRGNGAALELALDFARRIGARNVRPSLLISRLDLACDVQEITFPPPDSPRWVTRARHAARYDEGGAMTGMMFGRDRILVRIYDKSAELKKSRKTWLWTLWLKRGASDTLPVWRVELQLRREALRRHGVDRLARPEDVLGRLNAIWREALSNWLTLRIGDRVTRWDRAAIAPAWSTLIGVEFSAARESVTHEDVRLFDRWPHVRQIRGHLATICAHRNIESIEEGLRLLQRDLDELEDMEPGGFLDRLRERQAQHARIVVDPIDEGFEAAA
jgi:hypothetical protein